MKLLSGCSETLSLTENCTMVRCFQRCLSGNFFSHSSSGLVAIARMVTWEALKNTNILPINNIHDNGKK